MCNHLSALWSICWEVSEDVPLLSVHLGLKVNFPKVLTLMHDVNSLHLIFCSGSSTFLQPGVSERGHDTILESGWDKDEDAFVLVMQTGSVFLSVKAACSSVHHTILDE